MRVLYTHEKHESLGLLQKVESNQAMMMLIKKTCLETTFQTFVSTFFLFSFRMSNMSDSAYGEDYESSGSPGQVTMHKIQKSSSLRAPPPKKQKETVIKHSKSSGKLLERKVSFSEADPVKIESNPTDQPAKPKRSKEKKEKQIKVKSKKDKKDASDAEFVDQVNAKLLVLEQQQKKAAEVIEVIDHPNSMDISGMRKYVIDSLGRA